MSSAPEQKARKKIDRLLTQCGWIVQDYADMNLSARAGLADGLDSAEHQEFVRRLESTTKAT